MSKRISKFITIMLVAAMMLSCLSAYNAPTNVYAAKRANATKNIKQNNKKNKVKKVELFTDHYKVEGNFYVGLEKNNLDYENHKETNNQYIAYSENKTVKMTYTLSNNTITKITLA